GVQKLLVDVSAPHHFMTRPPGAKFWAGSAQPLDQGTKAPVLQILAITDAKFRKHALGVFLPSYQALSCQGIGKHQPDVIALFSGQSMQIAKQACRCLIPGEDVPVAIQDKGGIAALVRQQFTHGGADLIGSVAYLLGSWRSFCQRKEVARF